jgi:hypothetical protein
MERVAIGIRVHSGWGALVAVSLTGKTPEIVERQRIAITGTTDQGANQPYHAARNLKLDEAEAFIAHRLAEGERTAVFALEAVFIELRTRKYRVSGAAVLLAAGRTLPPLEKILAAHPLIHTAEGEFFRSIFCKACGDLHIPVVKIRERDLESSLQEKFGRSAAKLHKQVSQLGKSVGPPWTTDQKNATLAALLVLAAKQIRPTVS